VIASLAGGGDVAAEGTEALFPMFVNTLTSGERFSRLSAEQQRVASEKVKMT